MRSATDGTHFDALRSENERATRRLLAGALGLTIGLLWLVGVALVGPFALDARVLGVVLIGSAVVGPCVVAVARFRAPRTALHLTGARPLAPDEAPHVRNAFAEVCASAGLSAAPPTLHVVDDPAPNAFAVGLADRGGHVVVTHGLIALLPRYELRAVLAHEVAHITNDDVRATTLAVATVGIITRVSDAVLRWSERHARRIEARGRIGVLTVLYLPFTALLWFAVILAPSAARLLRSSVSQHREFLADTTGAQILRDPQSMVDALRRIEAEGRPLAHADLATAHLWFHEALELRGDGICPRTAREYATHPPLRDRIERLGDLHGGTVRLDRPLELSRPPAATGRPGDAPQAQPSTRPAGSGSPPIGSGPRATGPPPAGPPSDWPPRWPPRSPS